MQRKVRGISSAQCHSCMWWDSLFYVKRLDRRAQVVGRSYTTSSTSKCQRVQAMKKVAEFA